MSRWLPLAAALVIVAALLTWFGLGEVVAALRRASPALLALYLALTAVVLLGYGTRWWLVTAAVAAPARLTRCLAARLAGDAVSSLVPSARLAGEPVRVALVRAGGGARLSAATAGVAVDRLLEVIGNSLAVIAYVAIFAYSHTLEGQAPRALVGGFALLLIALAALLVRLRLGHRPFAPLYGERARRLLPRLARWGDAVRRVETHLVHFFGAHPRTFLIGLGVTVLTELVTVAQYHALLSAFGVILDLPTLLLVLLGGGLSNAAPTPGGLGALEATETLLVGAASGRPDLGFVVAVIVRLHQTLLLAAGLAVLAWYGVSVSTPARPALERAE